MSMLILRDRELKLYNVVIIVDIQNYL